MEKECSKCKVTKSLDLFYNYKASKDGKMARCKECQKEYNQFERGKEVNKNSSKKRRLLLKQQNLCIDCGKKSEIASSIYCKDCKKSRNESGKKYRLLLREQGLCINGCGKKTIDLIHCEECRESRKRYSQSEERKTTQKEYMKAYYEKQKEEFLKNYVPNKYSDLNLNEDDTCYLYIFSFANENFFKIGRSNNPVNRLNSMKRSFKYPIDTSIFCVVAATQRETIQLEKYLRIIFRQARYQILEHIDGKNEFYNIDILSNVIDCLEDNYQVVYP